MSIPCVEVDYIEEIPDAVLVSATFLGVPLFAASSTLRESGVGRNE